jgi:uncharacterized protein
MKKKQSGNDIIKCLNCENIDLKKVMCGRELVIDQCSECGGLWFDGRELITLTELGEFYIRNIDDSKKIKVEKNRIRTCPRCDVVLIPAKYQDIKIDRCPDCKGLWLDRGELEELSRLYGTRNQ